MTADITDKLQHGQRYIGIEVNEVFFKKLTNRYSDLEFINKSVVDLEDILRNAQITEIDAVLCGLPWASLPVNDQGKILEVMLRFLRNGGVFVTFAYLQGLLLPGAWALRRRLKKNFSTVATTKVIWWNFPPAFAYVCYR